MLPPTLDFWNCKACGQLEAVPGPTCRKCGDDQFERQAASGRAKVMSWTVIRRAPARFRHEAPYAVALIELEEGVRMTVRLREIPDDVRTGDSATFDARPGDQQLIFAVSSNA